MHRAKGFHHWKRFLSFILLVFILTSLYSILEVFSYSHPGNRLTAFFNSGPGESGYWQGAAYQNDFREHSTQTPIGNAALAGAFNVPCGTESIIRYPMRVLYFQEGIKDNLNTLEPPHSIPEMALYAPEGTLGDVYVSLGFGGEIILGIEPEIRPYSAQWIRVVETSPGDMACEDNPEQVQIQVSESETLENAHWSDAAHICQSQLVQFEGEPIIRLIRIVDVSNQLDFPSGEGGYDLDGLIVYACPASEVIPTSTDTPIPQPSSTGVNPTSPPNATSTNSPAPLPPESVTPVHPTVPLPGSTLPVITEVIPEPEKPVKLPTPRPPVPRTPVVAATTAAPPDHPTIAPTDTPVSSFDPTGSVTPSTDKPDPNTPSLQETPEPSSSSNPLYDLFIEIVGGALYAFLGAVVGVLYVKVIKKSYAKNYQRIKSFASRIVTYIRSIGNKP